VPSLREGCPPAKTALDRLGLARTGAQLARACLAVVGSDRRTGAKGTVAYDREVHRSSLRRVGVVREGREANIAACELRGYLLEISEPSGSSSSTGWKAAALPHPRSARSSEGSASRQAGPLRSDSARAEVALRGTVTPRRPLRRRSSGSKRSDLLPPPALVFQPSLPVRSLLSNPPQRRFGHDRWRCGTGRTRRSYRQRPKRESVHRRGLHGETTSAAVGRSIHRRSVDRRKRRPAAG
jgi:hypothetical protein